MMFAPFIIKLPQKHDQVKEAATSLFTSLPVVCIVFSIQESAGEARLLDGKYDKGRLESGIEATQTKGCLDDDADQFRTRAHGYRRSGNHSDA